jgi:signal transduction histidine kinase
MARVIEDQVRRLKHNDALRRELIANVSHDLRTPLALLQGHLETLQIKSGALSEDERGRHVAIAAHQCRGLARRIGELFELAKLEAQETLPQREPFAIAELVQDVVLKFRLEAERRRIAIVADMAADLPFVHADIGLIERALDNLLGNALRYTPAGGEIRVALAATPDQLCLRVSDTGRGIPPEDLPHVFDRFYCDRGRAPHPHDGAGLGLAITRRIVELHGGTIRVESPPNRGACFTVCLPLAT